MNMFLKKQSHSKKRSILVLAVSLIVEFAITLLTVGAYRHAGLTDIEKTILQAFIYILLILFSLVMIKLSGHTWAEAGLFKRKLPLQLLAGLLIGGIFLFVPFAAGWRPHKIPVCSIVSFLLVGFSEELFSRGLVLKLVQDIASNDNWAVLIQAMIFGLIHYPIQGSVGQVIQAFFIALIFGALRVEFSNTLGVCTFAAAHWIYDLLL